MQPQQGSRSGHCKSLQAPFDPICEGDQHNYSPWKVRRRLKLILLTIEIQVISQREPSFSAHKFSRLSIQFDKFIIINKLVKIYIKEI